MILVAAGAVALWLLGGVTLTQVGSFLAYHAVFVVIPGWLAYRLLVPRDALRFRQLVVGWALGYVLEVLAFAGTAAITARWLLLAYPPVMLMIAALLWRRRVSGARAAGPAGTRAHVLSPAWRWSVALLCLLALTFVGLEYFGSTPLPTQVGRVSYGIDTVWYLSIAGEALHHWPVSDPTVVGQPLHYHLFSSFDPAAIAQVTGLDLPVVFFRLYVVPMVLLAVLGLCLAGMSFGGAWAGPLAAGLVLFVGELNLDPHVGYRFANELGDDVLAISPSFLMGTALFAPLLALLCDLAARAGPRRLPYGPLTVFALLTLGVTGAKAPIPTVLLGGLGTYVLWYLIARRRLHRPVAVALGLVAGAFGLFWLLAYGGAGSDGMALHPPGVIRQMDVTNLGISLLHPSGAWSPLAWAVLTALGLVGAYGAQLVGVVTGAGRERREVAMMLLALLVFGQLPYLLYTHPGLSQVFFSEYGVIAACLLAAEGLRRLWARADRRALVSFAAGAVGVTLLLAFALPALLGLGGSGARRAYLYLDGAMAILLGAAYVLALARPRLRVRGWAYVAVAALAVGGVGRALTVVAPTIGQLSAGRPLYSQTGPGMTIGLYRALDWVRRNTNPATVLAVNNFRDWSLIWSDGWAVPDDFNYSAFAERRVFLEGWLYSEAAADAGDAVLDGEQMLFSDRLKLNNEIFQWAHADALRELAERYGVGYLLVDRVHNSASPRLAVIARPVFSDRDATVYAVPRYT